MGAAFVLGLPFVLNVVDTVAETLYAMAALLVVAAVAAVVIVAFLRRPNRPFSPGRAPDSAPAAPVRTVEYSLDTRAWSLPLLKRLDWRRFEELCTAYFETLGFTSQSTRLAADGAVDIDLYAAGSEHRSIIVRCKAWTSGTVGIDLVRKLHTAMTAENVGEGTLVTSGQFTREAKDFAAKQNINLMSGAELLKNIAALVPEQAAALLKLATQGDFATPTCPSCAVKMVSRMSTDAGRKFWGCRNYPRCKQTFFSTHNAPA
jgi:restriction system protein